jgi:hypothetical protein
MILSSILHCHTSPYQQINFLATDAAKPKLRLSPEQLQGNTNSNQAITQENADEATSTTYFAH